MSEKPRIALIFGGNDQIRKPGWLRLHSKGSSDVFQSGELEAPDVFQITKGYFRQRVRYGFGKYDLLINFITDADQNGAVGSA